MSPTLRVVRCLGVRAGGPGFRRAPLWLCLAALIAYGCGAPPPRPEIALADGEAVKRLLASAKGKVLVVNVWATFCIPCIEEMPELAQFYRERDAKRVEFLGLNADPVYTIEDTVKPFVAEKGLPFPVHVLDGLPPDELAAILGVGTAGWGGELPATFVIDAGGTLRRHWFERAHLKDLSAAVAEIAAK